MEPPMLQPPGEQRPWGSFVTLALNEPCTVKIITVAPGARLSLQRHALREEQWTALDPGLLARVGDEELPLNAGETLLVPQGALHRITNPTKSAARVLEVSRGIFQEADIERLEDDFGRR